MQGYIIMFVSWPNVYIINLAVTPLAVYKDKLNVISTTHMLL